MNVTKSRSEQDQLFFLGHGMLRRWNIVSRPLFVCLHSALHGAPGLAHGNT